MLDQAGQNTRLDLGTSGRWVFTCDVGFNNILVRMTWNHSVITWNGFQMLAYNKQGGKPEHHGAEADAKKYGNMMAVLCKSGLC